MKKSHYLTSMLSVPLAIWLVWITSTAAAQTTRYETLVKPAQDEDIARDCRYELTLPNLTRPIRAVWVIFERGSELTTLYRDPEVIAFAARYGGSPKSHFCSHTNIKAAALRMALPASLTRRAIS